MKLVAIIFLCCNLVGGNVMNRFVNNYDDYYYDEFEKDFDFRSASSKNIFYNGDIVCGDMICQEKIERLVISEPYILIPNAFNITCERCYNKNNRTLIVNPITQQKQVLVFEKISHNCYNPVANRVVNDGCKCN